VRSAFRMVDGQKLSIFCALRQLLNSYFGYARLKFLHIHS
jgi:hypothetical protein